MRKFNIRWWVNEELNVKRHEEMMDYVRSVNKSEVECGVSIRYNPSNPPIHTRYEIYANWILPSQNCVIVA